MTQEDVLNSGRTDVRIAGAGTVLLLELKQKPELCGPNDAEMKRHHNQLEEYMRELIALEKVKLAQSQRRIAGFLVVMYNDGKSFRVERTTYNQS